MKLQLISDGTAKNIAHLVSKIDENMSVYDHNLTETALKNARDTLEPRAAKNTNVQLMP
jgi:hypothetical protein